MSQTSHSNLAVPDSPLDILNQITSPFASPLILNTFDVLSPFHESFHKGIRQYLAKDRNNILSTTSSASRKQSSFDEIGSEIEHSKFGSAVYDGIENFLDDEGLFIISPSPILTKIELKPSVGLFKKMSLDSTTHDGNSDKNTAANGSEITEIALPSFLAKRTISADPVSGPRNLLLSHVQASLTKSNFGRAQSSDFIINESFKE